MHQPSHAPDLTIDDPAPGDLGWIVQAHGRLYGESMGWGSDFEGIVAQIVADYASRNHARERCWIARRGSTPVGSVMLTRDHRGPDPERTARLRVLLVDPAARGAGLGLALCRRVIEQARDFGDERIVLTTTARQVEARRIYEKCGFELIRTTGATEFDPSLRDEEWQLVLTTGSPFVRDG